MLLILTSAVTERLKYITGLLLGDLLGIGTRFTISPEEFSAYEGPGICYAHEPLAEGVFIESAGLLFETDIRVQTVEHLLIDGIPVLFESAHPSAGLRFDPFAAAFYMVSRYEEYHSHQKDGFGRFPATESIAFKRDFLKMPVVNLWAGMLADMLLSHFPGMKFRYPQYRYTPTIDIDHAWCYRGRNLTRTMGGLGRSLMRGEFGEMAHRIKVLAGIAPDPYDNYGFVDSVHGESGNHPLWFILFADYGGNDNNVTVTSRPFQQLLRELDRHGGVGIHPSLSSNKYLARLEDEFFGLCAVLDRHVTISRQHFLKFGMPKTYRLLIHLGITDDYSMGYASHPGFRAGIASPFPFFDLAKNETTQLIVHPVSLMDVTMKDYLRLTTVQSLETAGSIIRTIRSVNGEYVSLWHNESLGDTGRWEGWRAVYKEMVKLASD